MALGMEFTIMCILSNCSTTESHPSPSPVGSMQMLLTLDDIFNSSPIEGVRVCGVCTGLSSDVYVHVHTRHHVSSLNLCITPLRLVLLRAWSMLLFSRDGGQRNPLICPSLTPSAGVRGPHGQAWLCVLDAGDKPSGPHTFTAFTPLRAPSLLCDF